MLKRCSPFTNKKALTVLKNQYYGLNTPTVKKFLAYLLVSINSPMYTIFNSQQRTKKATRMLNSMVIDFKLRLLVFTRLARTINSRSYQGVRHMRQLPTRGQRTHSNGCSPRRLHVTGKYFPITGFGFKLKFKPLYFKQRQDAEKKRKKKKNKKKLKTNKKKNR